MKKEFKKLEHACSYIVATDNLSRVKYEIVFNVNETWNVRYKTRHFGQESGWIWMEERPCQ